MPGVPPPSHEPKMSPEPTKSLPGGVRQPPLRSTDLLELTLFADISHHPDFKKLCMFQTVQPQTSHTVIEIRTLDAWGLNVEKEVDLLTRG